MSASADRVVGVLNQLLQSNVRIEALMQRQAQQSQQGQQGQQGQQPQGGGGNSGVDTTSAADLSTSMAVLVEAIDKAKGVKEKTGKALKSIITDVGDALAYAAQVMGNNTANDVINFFELIVKKGGAFLGLMLMWGVTGPLAMAGGAFFSLTVVMMAGIFQKLFKVNEDVLKGVETIVNMGKAAAWFALAMVAYAFAAPIIAKGALYFSLIVTGMTWIFVKAKAVDGEVTSGIDSILKMAKGAALFGLAMIVYSLAAPYIAIGALAFAVITMAMTWIFKMAAKNDSTATNGAHVILGMAFNAVLFGLAMIGWGLATPLIAAGALAFVIIISAMMFIFGVLAKKLPEMEIAARTLKTMMWPAIGFMLLFVAVSYFVKEVAIGALTTILAIGAMIFTFGYLAKKLPEIKTGAKALKTMQWAIPIIMGTFIAVGYFWKEAALGALVTTLGIAALALSVSFLGGLKNVETGAERLKKIAVPFIMFSAGMFILGHGGDWANMLVGVISISIAAVVLGTAAAILGTPEIAMFAETGAMILIQLSASFLIFSAGVFLLSKSKFTMKDVLVLGALIVTLGGAFAAMGVLSIPIVAGSFAIASLGGALLIAAPGMTQFKKVGWKKKDSESLKSAIDGLLNGFGNVGFWTIGKAMLAAGTVEDLAESLIPMSKGLVAFKKAGFSKRLGEDMKLAVSSLFEAFSVPFSELSLMDYIQISAGIDMVGTMGNAISKLAEGVADMANLTVTEYEVVNAGTDKAKIVPKAKRQLSKDDFKLAHDGVMLILGYDPDAKNPMNAKSGILSAIMRFGYMIKHGEGYFSDSPIEYGINYLSKLSGAISTLASGVADMANLQVTEYEVVNPGTDKAKLVPKSKRRLNQTDFSDAATNTTTILNALKWPIYHFGKTITAGEGKLWGDGYVGKGLQGLSQLSGSLGNLAQGVADMANLEVTTNKIINPGTDKAKLVPDETIKLNEGHFYNAGVNVNKIIDALKWPLYNFGKTVENGWGDEYITIGIQALADLTDPISGLADMVVKLGTGQFELKELGPKDPKTGIQKLVTKRLITPGEAVYKAKAVLDKILYFIPQQIGGLAYWWEKNGMEEKSETALAGLDVMNDFMEGFVDLNSGYVKALEKYNKTKEFKVTGEQMMYGIKLVSRSIVELGSIHPDETTTDKLLTLLDSMEVVEDVIDVYLNIKKATEEFLKITIKTEPLDLLIAAAKKLNTLGTTFSDAATAGIIQFYDSMSYVKDSLWTYIGMAKALQKANVDKTRPEDVLFRFSNALIHLGTTFNKKMRKAELNNFKIFNDQIKRLAMMASPFEKFERSFGRMAKHMGVFATNFKIMDPTSIYAFKHWADSMVLVGKIDISNAKSIIDFINNAVSAAFGGGDEPADDGTPPQDLSENDRNRRTETPRDLGGGTGGGNGRRTQTQTQTVKINSTEIATAIAAALRNLTVQSITVKGDIVNS